MFRTDRLTGLTFLLRYDGLPFILIAAAMVFSLSLANGFVWDDWTLVVSNEAYRLFDLKAIFAGKANSLEYLPVRDLSLALDAQVWGMSPFGFHLTNLLLYLAGLAALSMMVRQLAVLAGREDAGPLAFWATLIFAIHPLHAEVVTFITARNTLLAGMFLFMSAGAVFRGLREDRPWLIGAALLSYLLAVFSKAITVFFPVFLLALMLHLPRDRSALWRQTTALLGFSVIAAVAVWVHAANAADTGIMNDDILRFGTGNRWLILAKAVQIPVFYLGKLFVPYSLSVEYTVSFGAGSLVRAGVAGLVLIAMLAGAWLLRRRAPMTTLGTAWFMTALLPVLNLFPTHPVVADRYAFISVVGFGLVCASLLASPAGIRKKVRYPVIAVLVLWSGMSMVRTLDWRSDATLWSSAIAVDMNASRINLAQALWKEGRHEEAIEHLREERRRKGTHYASLYEGMLQMRQGRTDDAITSFRLSLMEGGDAFRDVQISMAQAYEAKGDIQKASDHYLKALESRSLDVNGRYEKLATDGIERIRSQHATRIAALREQARSRPGDIEAQLATALALHSLGLYGEAEQYYRVAMELGPSRWDVWYNTALTHMRRRQFGDAVGAFEKAVMLKPGNVNALNNLGICYLHLKDYRRAELAYQHALEQNPGFFYAAFNLGRLYFITGDAAHAREAFVRARALAAGDFAIQGRIDQYLDTLGHSRVSTPGQLRGE